MECSWIQLVFLLSAFFCKITQRLIIRWLSFEVSLFTPKNFINNKYQILLLRKTQYIILLSSTDLECTDWNLTHWRPWIALAQLSLHSSPHVTDETWYTWLKAMDHDWNLIQLSFYMLYLIVLLQINCSEVRSLKCDPTLLLVKL